MRPILALVAITASACARPAVAPVPAAGGTLRFAQVATLRTLDPAQASWVGEGRILDQLADGLVDIDANLQIRASLADTWEVADGGRTFRFHLREGLRTSAGQALGASDVAACLSRLAAPGRHEGPTVLADVEGAADYHAGRAQSISGISTPDPLTLVFRLTAPSSRFLYQLATSGAVIFGPAPDPAAWAEGRVPGTGPFRLVAREERQRDGDRVQRLRFARQPSVAFGVPKIDAMVWDVYDNTSAMLRALPRERYDVVYAPQPQQPAFDKALARHRRRAAPRLGFVALYFDCSRPPFDRASVRRAAALAVDRDGVGPHLLAGYNLPGTIGELPAAAVLHRDPEAARALAQRSGLDPRRPTHFRIAFSENFEYGELSGWIRDRFVASLAPLGLAAEVVAAADGAALDKRFFAHADHVYLYGSTADTFDPCLFFDPFRTGNLAANWSWYSDPVVDEAYAQCVRSMDLVTQRNAIARLMPKVADDAPLVPLSTIVQLVYEHPRVAGFSPSVLEAVDFRNVTLGPEPEGE